MPEFNFAPEINRREVPALKVHSMVLGTDGMDLFAAGVADMDFAAPPAVLEALNARSAHGVFGYETVPDGLIPALTGWLQSRHSWHVDRSHILRAPNVLNALSMAANLFSVPGDGIIIQPPVFFDFSDIIVENGRRLVSNPLILRNSRYEIDFDGLEQLARDPRSKMLFLCNPHNPVGRVWTCAELTRLGEICRAHNVLVVSDEIHADITFAGYAYTPFASVSQADALNSVICLSPAKSFNIAACCASFTVVPDGARRKAFQAENSRLTVNKNNAFASVAMQAAYENGAPWLEAAHLQEDLRRAGIEPWGWIINSSLAAAETTQPLLRKRARSEREQIAKVRDVLAKRYAVVPIEAQEPIGAEKLSALCRYSTEPTAA